MAFYRYGSAQQNFGIVPLIMAALPLVQGAMQAGHLDQTNQYAAMEKPTSPLIVAAAVIGGLGLVGGLGYLLWKEK